MKQPKVPLSQDEQVLFSAPGGKIIPFLGSMGGHVFLTNKRIIDEALLGAGMQEDLGSIDNCKISTYRSLLVGWIFPLGCVEVTKKSGDSYKIDFGQLRSSFVKARVEFISTFNEATQSNTSAEVDNKGASAQTSIEDKLRKLNELKEKNLINDEEYNKRKEKLLEEL